MLQSTETRGFDMGSDKYEELLNKRIRVNELTANMSQNKTIVRNELLEAFLTEGNLTALKILFYIAKARILDTKEPILTMHIDLKKLNSYTETTPETIRRNLKSLTKTTLTFQGLDDNKEYVTYISALPRVKIIPGKNLVEVDIYREVLELVAKVEKNFSVVHVDLLLNQKSIHAFRMLMLLERINNYSDHVAKRKTIELDELNAMFGTKYKRVGEFASNILAKARDDIAQTPSNLNFDYQINYVSSGKGRPRAVSVTIDLIDNDRSLFSLAYLDY